MAESSIPSLDEFLSDAKPLNPDASHAELIDAYRSHFGVEPSEAKPRATLPTWEEFKKEAKPLNPEATNDELKTAWQDNFQVLGAREKKPSFWEAFKQGAKQGSLGVQESYQGTKERLLDPNDPLKKFTSEAGNALAEEATKHGIPDDLASQPFWDRIRDPEYLGNFMGNILVQSAPSALGAVAGGVVGGPVGAAAGMAGVTFFQEAGQSYREAYGKYKKAGFSDEKAHDNAYQASGISGAVSGLVNSMAVPASLMSPAKSAMKNLFMRYAANVAVDTGDQVTGNIIAKTIQDPARDLTSGVPEAVAGSALLGAPETMGAVKLGTMPNRVAKERQTPDQGVKPDLTGGDQTLRDAPLREGGARAQTEIEHVDPILKSKNVDQTIENAGKVTDGIPIDMEALEKEVGGEVEIELDRAKKQADEILKTKELDESQTILDDVGVKKAVESTEKQQSPHIEEDLKKFKFDAVSPQDLPDAPINPEFSNGGMRQTMTKPQYEALSEILALDDTKMVLYQMRDEGSKKPFDGFVDRRIPGTIFVNAKSVGDPSTIVFHELQHTMQRSEIFDSYRKVLMEELQPNAKSIAKSVHGKKLKSSLLFEEIMADVHGDAMSRPSFHQKLIAEIEKQHGEAKTRTKMMQFVQDLRTKIAKITQLITRRDWRDQAGKTIAERYVKNLERVHDALASALATHYKGKIEAQKVEEVKEAEQFIETTVPQAELVKPEVLQTANVDNGKRTESTQDVARNQKSGTKSETATGVPKEEKTKVLEAKSTEPRDYDTIQKDIDAEEDRLEAEGVDPTRLYDPEDPLTKSLVGWEDWKPMPEKLAKLYRERFKVEARDKDAFRETMIRDSKLGREIASGALDQLGLGQDSPAAFFNETLKRWGVDTTTNLGKLYNYFLYQKYGDRNMGVDFEDKFGTFRWGGTAENPRMTFHSTDGRGVDPDVMANVEKIYNAIEKSQGREPMNFNLKSSRQGIEGTSIDAEGTVYMPGPAAQGPTYTVSEPTRIDGYIRTLQDKNVDLKRLIEAIQKAGHKVPDDLNPVFREEMYHKRAQQRADDFTNQELKPLLDWMRANKISLKQMDDYMHARHVINDGLNQRLQDMNPDLAGTPEFEKLAGITDAEAKKILNGANKKVMELGAKKIDAMVEKTRNMMVEYGLESQERVDGWREQYTSYVPLHREGFEDEGKPTGTGMSVRGTTAKDRLGSALKVVDVVANIAQARDQVISRGEKMRPVVALAGLFLKFPNKDIAKLDKYAPVTTIDPTTGLEVTIPGDLADYKRPMIRRRDPKTNEVKSYPDPSYKGRDNVVNFRIGGKDYAIIFNEQNERAMQIAKGLKNLDTPQLNGLMKAVAPFTRYLASVNTQYNPIFGIVNFVRDAQFAMLTLKSTELAGKQGEMVKNAQQMTFGIFQDARAVRRGEVATSPAAQWWSRFEHVGGPTGYRDLFFTSTERADAMKELLTPRGWRQIRSFGQFMKKAEGTWLFEVLSDYNLMMENSIRLAVFKTGVENGLTDIKAASLAKNITVNFNKKGQIGAQMGSLYAFFNANVQGTARIFETLFERSGDGYKLGSVGKQIIVGGLLVGVLQAFALGVMGFDDEEPPEYIKSRNIVIPVPGSEKGYLSIPMPLGFNLLPSVGRLTAEAVFAGLDGRSPKLMDKGAKLMDAMLDTFNPLGSSASPYQALLPTVADPLAALSENKDWTGKQIYQEDHSGLRPTPGHTRSKDTATIWAIGLSKMINWATGGTDYVPGALSPSPDVIDYLFNQATGGVGREVGKLAQTGRSALTGEELPMHKVPLAGRFVGSSGGSTGVRDRFYDNVRDVNASAMEIEGRMKHGERFDEVLKEHPEARLKSTALRFQKQLSELRRQKHDLLSNGASKEQIQQKEKQMTNLMQMFNAQVDRLKKN